MIKDPCHRDETPYDILGLSPNATAAQIQQALVQFMKNPKNRPRLAQAQQASMKLRTPVERAWVDLWFYRVEPPQGELSETEFIASLQVLQQVPVHPAETLYTDLDNAEAAPESKEIQYSKMRMLDLRRYDGLAEMILLPPIDR
jgi:hypothetical protein